MQKLKCFRQTKRSINVKINEYGMDRSILCKLESVKKILKKI